MVNFLRNDNSRCCCALKKQTNKTKPKNKQTNKNKTESAEEERRIYGSRPAGLDTTNVESTDPGRNMVRRKQVFTNFLLLAFVCRESMSQKEKNSKYVEIFVMLPCTQRNGVKRETVDKYLLTGGALPTLV